MASTALKAISLRKTYVIDGTQIRAVDDVSVTLHNGEFVAMVGPSGSGKTTMLALLAGLLNPDEGEVYVKDENLSRMGDSQLTTFRRHHMGFTFQANNLVPYLTALENVELMLELNGKVSPQDRATARDLLVTLDLGDRLRSLPWQLSGGQQQRVAIARAMVHSPEVVLMDEPTASLDTERASQVIDTFARLIHEENRAGMMVTHDFRICAYADRIIQMEDGRLVRSMSDRAEIEAFASQVNHKARPLQEQGRAQAGV
jgi:putative ABC transport system ATP-binding protein